MSTLMFLKTIRSHLMPQSIPHDKPDISGLVVRSEVSFNKAQDLLPVKYKEEYLNLKQTVTCVLRDSLLSLICEHFKLEKINILSASKSRFAVDVLTFRRIGCL